jgi:hypothetical protein
MVEQKPITRKKALNRIALAKLDLEDRKRYIHQILALKASETELILCDETPIDFGGCGGKQHVSATKGISVYSDVTDPRFSRMQWDSASTEMRPKRRVVIWRPESDDLTIELARIMLVFIIKPGAYWRL